MAWICATSDGKVELGLVRPNSGFDEKMRNLARQRCALGPSSPSWTWVGERLGQDGFQKPASMADGRVRRLRSLIAARARPSNGPGRRRPPPSPSSFYTRSRRDEAESIIWQPWKTYTRAAVFLQRERAVGPARPSMTPPARFTAEGR
jgi:hypothetical protein